MNITCFIKIVIMTFILQIEFVKFQLEFLFFIEDQNVSNRTPGEAKPDAEDGYVEPMLLFSFLSEKKAPP